MNAQSVYADVSILILSTYLHLSLVPPVLFGTSGNELSQCGTIYCNLFGFIPVDFHFCQVFKS